MRTRLEELARLVSERTRRWPLYQWYWGDAIAVDGLLAVSEAELAPGREHALALLRRWLGQLPPGYADALAPGAALVRLVEQGELPAQALDRFLAAVEALPLLFGEVPALEPHLPRYRFGVCVDALYHLPPALAAIGRFRHNPALVSRAVLMASQILVRLGCPDGWAQWYDAAQDRNNGVAWSRGAGWAVLGVLDTIALAKAEADTGELRACAGLILQRLAATQGRGGHWGPILGRTDLGDETSVAAFFVAAAWHPEASRLEVPATALESAEAATLGSVGPNGVYEGVSTDVLPDFDRSSYERFSVEPSPWGQGVALRALAALARSNPEAGRP